MWFALILFWHSLILVRRIILYWIVFLLLILFLYVWTHYGNQYREWSSHHLYNQIYCTITLEASVWNNIPDSGLLPRVMVFSIFIIPVTILISSTKFMVLGYSQNWSTVMLLFRRQHSGLILVTMNSWSCSQSHQFLTVFIDLVDHGPR